MPAAAASAPAGFGPVQYVRGTGAPIASTESFAVCRPERAFRLRVDNGPNGRPRVSSAAIVVNGVEVVRERDLSQQVAAIEQEITLRAENSLAVRLAGQPGGTIAVRVVSAEPCLEIAITSPTAGARLDAGHLVVRGTVRGAPEIGVTVNGQRAAVLGEDFAALLDVEPDAVDLAAVATAPDGATVEARQLIAIAPAAPSPLIFRVNPGSALPGVPVRFSLASLVPVVEVRLDATGRGTVDFRGPDLQQQPFTYERPGLYFPAVTVVDAAGAVHPAVTFVDVVDRAALDARLQARWSGMKAALRQSDVARALEAIYTPARDRYRQLFDALTVPLSQIDGVLTDIALVDLDDFQAEYQMLRSENGETISYYVLFVRDADGIWRLKFF
jgi:hypothetical protein